MYKYIVRRVLLFVPVWLGVAILTFFLLHLVPGDPARAIFHDRPLTEAALQQARHQMGLDQPIYTQLARFLWNSVHLNLGTSWQSHTPVWALVKQRMPYTIELALVGLIGGAVLGIVLGVIAGVRQGTRFDGALLVASLIFISIPGFWFALMLIYVFAVWLHWVPVTGANGIASLILPGGVLAVGATPGLVRITRASMLEVLRTDYVRTARAKGLLEGAVRYKHALRNALNPVVTILGLSFGGLLGGAFIIEQVFSRPGLGTLIVQAIFGRDYPLVQGVVLLIATTFLLMNLLVDLSYAWLDPRIRYQ